jgi:hypothetical protein
MLAEQSDGEKGRMNRYALLLTMWILGVSMALPHAAVDITGKWTASFNTGIGRVDYDFDFVVKSGKLTGKVYNSVFGAADVLDGKVDGEKVTFVEMMDASIRVEYTGRIVSADEIQFTRQVSDLATEELVAKRVKAS